MTKAEQVLAAIDTANARDPRQDEGQPEALLYGQRMSAELARLYPDASDLLQIAVRGQHVERWVLARSDYAEGKAGYLKWRRDLATHHANRVGALMTSAGYDMEAVLHVGRMLRKEGVRRDPEVQALEDTASYVFVKYYFSAFAAKHAPDKIQDIVEKTARKMSPMARAQVLADFDLPEPLAAAFRP